MKYTQEGRDHEVDKLRSILARNDYPSLVVDREINKFIDKKSQPIPFVLIRLDKTSRKLRRFYRVKLVDFCQFFSCI